MKGILVSLTLIFLITLTPQQVKASGIEIESLEVLTTEVKNGYAAQFLVEISTEKEIQIITTSSRSENKLSVVHSNDFERVNDSKYLITTNELQGGSEGAWEVYSLVVYATDGSFVHLQESDIKELGGHEFKVYHDISEGNFSKGTDMINVPVNKEFTITFNKRVLVASVSNHNVYMVDRTGKRIEIEVHLDDSKKKLLIKPKEQLKPRSRYVIFVKDLKTELHKKRLKINTKFEVYTK